jgi:hypothetical protein
MDKLTYKNLIDVLKILYGCNGKGLSVLLSKKSYNIIISESALSKFTNDGMGSGNMKVAIQILLNDKELKENKDKQENERLDKLKQVIDNLGFKAVVASSWNWDKKFVKGDYNKFVQNLVNISQHVPEKKENSTVPKVNFKAIELDMFANDTDEAYRRLLNAMKTDEGETKHIKTLRIYATNATNKSKYFLSKNNIVIDECILMVRRPLISKTHESWTDDHILWDEDYYNGFTESVRNWKNKTKTRAITNLTIIEYDRLSDFYYVIADRFLLTDILPYDLLGRIQTSSDFPQKMPIVTSNTDYIQHYTTHFDNYRKYYESDESCDGRIIYQRRGDEVKIDK